jgi:hypothetical protein
VVNSTMQLYYFSATRSMGEERKDLFKRKNWKREDDVIILTQML